MSPCKHKTPGFTEAEGKVLLGHVRQPASRELPPGSQQANLSSLPKRSQVLSRVLMPELVTSSVEGHLAMSTSASIAES